MKRIVLIFTLLLIIYDSIAQNVGISETSITPHPSAMLEVRSSNKGILIPRVVLIQTTLSAPIANPQTSLLVYNTATQNDVYPGYYYWDGAKWVRLLINQDLSFAWLLTGNNISPQHFIGTLNNEDFKIYTNNSEKIRITTQGFMGIGTSNPLAILHVKGNIRHSGFLISEGNYAKEWMKFDETPFGHSLILGAGALTVVGGGESSDSVRANIPPSQECLILSSDETGNNPAIQFITSVQSGWGNRVVPMTIVGNGKIGIGTISPTEQLHVKGSVRFEGVGAGTTETTGLVVDASGNVRTRTLNSIAFTGYTETDPNAWRLIGNSSTNP
ncbi:MAG: hypothetical protein N2Z72_00925 [Bacteroidales bacterium]|nr:hypothetical protein [Bacteroidales bacterium]